VPASDVDPVLGRVFGVHEFEGRLNQLGAIIEPGTIPAERVATVALPGKPGYFPPRTLRIVYVITDKGLIELKSTDVTALGSRFAHAPETPPVRVTVLKGDDLARLRFPQPPQLARLAAPARIPADPIRFDASTTRFGEGLSQ
jgi:hypothetical protein